MSSGKSQISPIAGWRVALAVWLGLLGLCLALQVHSGAWQSDFGGHADEGAHVVTGLMVRDYLAGGLLEERNPVRYAKHFYERFPKVAIGHYPPLFYGVEAVFFLPWRAPGSALVLMSVLSATSGWLTWRIGRDLLKSRWASLALAVVFCLMPLVRTYTSIVMSDMLLTVMIVLSTVAFARFAESEKKRDSLAFGVLAAGAILTKGSGLLLALVPPLTIVLTRRWILLRSTGLWIGAIPVLVLALPWLAATRHITAEGMSDAPISVYLREAVQFYPLGVINELGGLVVGLLIFGLVRAFWIQKGPKEEAMDPLPAALWSLVIGLPIFYIAVPSGLDLRYFLPMVPAALILSGQSMETLSGQLLPKALPWAVIVLALAIFFDTIRPVEKRHTGCTETIRKIISVAPSGDPANEITILVVSGAGGEGALIAAAAFEDTARLRVLRGSKVLASSDWLGRGYELKIRHSEDFRKLLRDRSVDFIVNEIPEDANAALLPEHRTRITEILSRVAEWERIGSVGSHRKGGRNRVLSGSE